MDRDALALGPINVPATLATLALRRPIFHSEADFQHALAWEIQRRYDDAEIRLEFKPPGTPPRTYLDIWVTLGTAAIAIELKYKTGRLSARVSGEQFDLLNHGANDLGRYDFLKDIARVEAAVDATPGATGFSVLLTNDSKYWTAIASTETIDANFRIHEGQILAGELRWGANAGGTTRGRERAINLSRPRAMRWSDYSDLGTRAGQFRSLVVSIAPNGRD